MRRGDYGYDAPYALVMFLAGAVLTGTAAAVDWANGVTRPAVAMSVACLGLLASAANFLSTTRRGKFIEWERILDAAALRGDERVLDLGCGRGAVLTAVARRLTTGRATGIDIWNTSDQSGNARDVTLRNASLEGVLDRVTIETGDMRALPFPDASFDLVVSSLAIHNIRSHADQRRAVAEAYRVLAPGGRFIVADIRAARSYARTLRDLGAAGVECRRLGWRFWWGNPLAATSLVRATKPPAAARSHPLDTPPAAR